MATVTTPRNGVPIGIATVNGQRLMVEVHPEYLRWFSSLTDRVGGVTGPSNNDLTLSQFEDAGIEEIKLTAYKLADQVAAMESGISALREQVTQLQRQLQDINEGQML